MDQLVVVGRSHHLRGAQPEEAGNRVEAAERAPRAPGGQVRRSGAQHQRPVPRPAGRQTGAAPPAADLPPQALTGGGRSSSMPVSEGFREFVLEQLERVAPVTSKKMFG